MHRNYHLSYDQTLIIMVFSVGALRLNRKRLKRVDSLIVIGRAGTVSTGGLLKSGQITRVMRGDYLDSLYEILI